MTTLRERAASWLLKERYDELKHAEIIFREAYRYQPWVFAADPVVERLQELSPDSLRFLTMMLGWESVASLGSSAAQTEQDRLAAVRRSQRGYDNLALIERMVSMWTDMAFGQNVALTLKGPDGKADEAAQAVWDEFWTAERNSYVLGPVVLSRLSERMLITGEVFCTLFVSRADGTSTLRTVDSEQVVGVHTLPDDDTVPVLYERQSVNGAGETVQRIYRDWRVSESQVRQAMQKLQVSNVLRADEERAGTDVTMAHLYWRGRNGRGWPPFASGVWWAYSYQQFLIWRLTLARSVATFWEDIETKGGSRAVDYVNTILQSGYATGAQSETNPAPPVSTPFVHNEAIKRQRLSLGTAAGDAQVDGMVLLSYAGLSGGIPPHWLGRPDMMQNRAVAQELLRPVMKQWVRYQRMWANFFEQLCRWVLRQAATYPRDNPRAYSAPVEGLNIDVTMDSPVDVDFETLTSTLVQFAQAGILQGRDISQIALRMPELGIAEPDEVSARMFPEGEAKPDGKPEGKPEAEPPSLNLEQMSPAEQRAILEAAARIVARG